MADVTAEKAHRYSAYLRLYVAWTPESGEAAWQNAHHFERLSDEQKQPGHWYRCEGLAGLIEVTSDGSGQWHQDGKLPEDVDPGTVIEIPAAEPAPTLLDEMIALLKRVPKTAPHYAETVEMIEVLKDLPTPERAARLVKSFQNTLATVPAVAEEQIRFLRQASQQMVGTELLAGKVRGYDVAGVLIVASIVEAMAVTDPQTCSAVLTKAAALEVGSLAELGSRVMQDCWWRKMQDNVTVGLDSLRSEGEKIVRSAQQGLYPEGHPELALDMYYGGLLQAIPYLLAAEEGYQKLKHAPNLTEDDAEAFAHKSETAEEKLVRIRTALLYAAQDVDLSRLRRKQAEVRELLRTDRPKAEALVSEIINLEFFYPLNFRSVLLGEAAKAADTASAT
ncbi:MAG: hypothetical protein M3Y72_00320 [Acidobacteriota bacterium]|nr:hypothetical protein [Acidobacteriota bacterium]